MNKYKSFKYTLIAAALTPALASAELTANLGVASQYLWRGQSLYHGGTISGGLDYNHRSGLYAGAWTSSEDDKTEYDLFAGWAGETDGGLGYDIGYIDYNYTGADDSCDGAEADACDFAEAHLGLSYAGFGADAYFGVGDYGHGGNKTDNKDNYYSLSYRYDKLTALVGYYHFDDSAQTYTHLDLSYAVTDELSFTVSKIVDQNKDANGDDSWDDDPQFMVAYTLTF